MPIDAIAPMHVREYMDIRGQAAKVRANRKKALLSHIFNKARKRGYTTLQNPCQGVKGFKETGRSRYITDAEFDLVKALRLFCAQMGIGLPDFLGILRSHNAGALDKS